MFHQHEIDLRNVLLDQLSEEDVECCGVDEKNFFLLEDA